MKARLPAGYGGGAKDQRELVKQAQRMQEDMAAKQAELEEREFTASSGGGVVEAKVNGKKQLLELNIKPEIVDPDDVEMLQDVIIAAVNEAMKTADEATEAEMGKITGAFSIPGMPGMF